MEKNLPNKSPRVDGVRPVEVQTSTDQPEEEKSQDTERESILLQWDAPESNTYSRGWKYYLLTAVVFLLVIIYSIYTRDWFVIVAAFVLAGFFYYYPTLKPKVASYKITQLGFYINDRIYPYNEIHSFWVFINQRENKLNIIFDKKYLPQLSILLLDLDPLVVRNTLNKYVPEQEGRTESLVDKFIRLLKL